MSYTLPEPDYPAGAEGMLGENCYTAPAMARAYADGFAAGAASRDSEIEALHKTIDQESKARENVSAMRAELAKEIEALRADALRYRAIRDGLEVDPDNSGIVVSLVDDFGGSTLRGEDADAAIDSAMKPEWKTP